MRIFKLELGDLCEMAERFSDDKEELKIPNMYYSEEKILSKIQSVKQTLGYTAK